MIWLYAGLLAVALTVYYGTIAKRNMWGLAALMDALGYAMEDMARHNIDKLKARYPGGFDPERSLHREGETE